MLNAETVIITPPRVPLVDPRTGLIDRAWYLFFLSLNRVVTAVSDDSALSPNTGSLLAGYDAALQALAQEVGTQSGLSQVNSQVAELQKQVESLQIQPVPEAVVFSAASVQTWINLVSRPSIAVGTSTVAGIPGDVRLHAKVGQADVYRFIPSNSDPLIDSFYASFAASVLSDLIVSRG